MDLYSRILLGMWTVVLAVPVVLVLARMIWVQVRPRKQFHYKTFDERQRDLRARGWWDLSGQSPPYYYNNGLYKYAGEMRFDDLCDCGTTHVKGV